MTPLASSNPASGAQSLAAWAAARRARLILAAGLTALALVAAGLFAYLQPRTWHYYTDGATVRRLARDTTPRTVLWEDAQPLPCNTNLPADACDLFVLADGVTLLFSSGGAAGNATLYSCRWNGQAWTDPAALPAVNSAFNERGPAVSPDGQLLFFSSDRPGGLGGYDLWVARWDGLTWAWPANLGYMVNTKFDESDPAVSPFDGRLFFTSDRAQRRLTSEEDRLAVKLLRERFKGADSDVYAADPVPADAAVNREIERMQSQLYSLRTGALGDPDVMRKLGGSPETEAAVERALAWLAANQEPNGCWSISRHRGAGGHDAAATGFALLTFLGRGVKPGDGSPYSGAVSNALAWLTGSAKINGDMRLGGNMYDQGIATLALTEAYGLTKDDKLKEPVQAAVNFIVDAQHADGGWRYTPKEAGDLSVSGWQIMALKSAELSGLMISETCLAQARAWLRVKMASGPHRGIYSYTAGSSGGQPAMQAAGFFCSQLLGISPNTTRARDSVAALNHFGFDPDKANIYYWYNAVLGAYQYQGAFWQAWNKRLVEHYLPAQCREGALAGSWDPSGHQHGSEMGRVIVTALCTLSLEVYYRYTPLYGLGYDPSARAEGSDGWDADRIPEVPLYRRARPVESLNSPGAERRPAFTRRGDFVYFASDRPGGAGGYDLYRARVNQAKEEAPERLGPEINTPADETSPALRLNGFQLLFASGREAPQPGGPRLYASTSRYVRALHDYTRTRGLAGRLQSMQGRLLLLAAALCSLLLFTRQCRRRGGNSLSRVGLWLSLLALAGLSVSLLAGLRNTVWCRYTDDVSIWKSAVDVKPRPVVWDSPAPLASLATGLVTRSSLQLAQDSTRLLLSQSDAPTGSVHVAASSWDGYTWSAPAPVEGVNAETNTQDAVITRDGQRIFFASDRAGGFGGYDLWAAVRRNGQWADVTNQGPAVNSAANERFPCPAPDGSRLYFASDRAGRVPKDFDLFSAEVLSAALGLATAVPLAALNTPANETAVSLCGRGDWLFFASDRATGRGQSDLYAARVLNRCETGAANLGSELNTSANEQGPAAGMEGFQLLFGSDRGAERSAGLRPLAANACEVMGRWDFSRWHSLGNLLYSLRWWILLVVAALVGILYILTHLKDLTSLRAKCLIASLLLHLLFLLLTALWIISNQFAESRSRLNQELSVSIDALAQERLALDVREKVMELPPSKDTAVAKQAEEALPVPDFKPAPQAVQAVAARSVAESFVAEAAPSAAPPEARETAAAKMPELPEIQPPKLDIALKVETTLNALSVAKAAEAFQPLDNMPSVSTSRVDVVIPAPVADFKPAQKTAQDVTAQRVAESFVAEAAPSAQTPQTPEAPAAEMPELPDLQPPQLAIALKVDAPRSAAPGTKAAELFQPLADAPSASTARADVALPGALPDFTSAQRAVPTVSAAARGAGAAASFVADAAPSAETESTAPRDAVAAAAQMPGLPELGPPKLEIALQVGNPAAAAAGGKAAEAFQPLTDAPAASTARADVLLPGPKQAQASAGVAGIISAASAKSVSASLIKDTGDAAALAEGRGSVSAGLTEVSDQGGRLAALLSGSSEKSLALNLPGTLDVPAGPAHQISPYKLRQSAKNDLGYLEGLGGSGSTMGAVDKALDWLTRHQSRDGYWDIGKYGGEAGRETGATGLALLCYLGWGVKHNEAGQYQPPAKKAVAWLVKQVKPDGDIRGKDADMYDQGIATIALAEAFALTHDAALRPVVNNMVQFIIKAQHAGTGGWRYRPGQAGDTSVLGWQLMSVLSARMGGFAIPDETVAGAGKWLTSAGGGEHGGLYGYENKTPMNAMVAEGMFCRQIMGVPSDDPRMRESAAFLAARLPSAAEVDLYYWYYGTLALYQHRGPAWEKWNAQLKVVLPALQTTSGDDKGSWAPAGSHGSEMGRVVTTAMATLSLEVYYRYLPFAFTKGAAAPPADAGAP